MMKWIKGAYGYGAKWTTNQKQQISAMLLNTNQYLPTEIHRKVRSLQDIAYWKGSEFRTVLLYVGMIVFKGYLHRDIYHHFLLLSSAVTICSSDEYKLFLPRARKMFGEYIEDQCELYGTHSLTSNFHNLIHIVDDVERFGNLNRISTYQFENCLGQIKSKLKLYNKPLEQVSRRLIEIANANMTTIDLDRKFVPSVKYNHYLPNDSSLIAFKEIIIRPDVLLSNRKCGDRFFLTTEKQIVEMQYVFMQNGEYYICGIPIIDKNKFFDYPFSSNFINIFQSKMTKGSVTNYKISEFKVKLICLKNLTDYVFIPLLHSY